MPLEVTIKCPHCGDVSKREIDYQDMQAPFLAKCRAVICKKYFAVKLTFTVDVKSQKIFDTAAPEQFAGPVKK